MITIIRTKLNNQKNIVSVLILGLSLLLSCSANAFESSAKSVLVIDNLTNTILLERNAGRRIPPASMSKLMTLYMVFDALRDERILLTDVIKVSKTASKKGGSKMFLNQGQKVTIENIIRGIIIHSGNDACIAIAETLSGTEAEFANDMNNMAKILGLKNSSFTNSTGWPDKNHYMSATDLAHVATRIRIEFPEYYEYFSEESFTWNSITQKNRNPILKKGLGADGLKTGHTEEAGYGLVGSAQRGNRRITFVLSGLKTSSQRTVDAEKIINWAYRDFEVKKIAQRDQKIGRIPVWLGEKKDVALFTKEDIFILVPVSQNITLETKITYDRPILAPFEAGHKAPAKLKVSYKAESKAFMNEYELFVFEGSETGSFLNRISAATTIMMNYVKKSLN